MVDQVLPAGNIRITPIGPRGDVTPSLQMLHDQAVAAATALGLLQAAPYLLIGNHTLALAENSFVFRVDSPTAVVITLPANLPEGFGVTVGRWGVGSVTFVTATGAVIRSVLNTIPDQYGEVSVYVWKNAGGVSAEYTIKGDVG